jgi:hypothetical protein
MSRRRLVRRHASPLRAIQERSAPAFGALAEALGDSVLVTGAGRRGRADRRVAGSSGAPAWLGVANGVVAVREGLQPYRRHGGSRRG